MQSAADNDKLAEAFLSTNQVLKRLSVSPVVIGGYALAMHAIQPTAKDVDLLVHCDQVLLRDVAAQLKAEGALLDHVSELSLQAGNSAELRIYWEQTQVDIVPAADSRAVEAYDRAVRMELLGVSIRVATLVDLIVDGLRYDRLNKSEAMLAKLNLRLTPSEKTIIVQDCLQFKLMQSHDEFVQSFCC